MEKERMLEWIGTHNVGISSRTMWCGVLGIKPNESARVPFDVPHDADDFGRCFDLVTFANISPDDDFPRIVEVFPWYKPVLDCWGTLTELFLDKDYHGVNDILHRTSREVMKLKGYTEISRGHWVLERVI